MLPADLWSPAVTYQPEAPPPQVVEVVDALLTEHHRTPVEVSGTPINELLGAVHDRHGWLVPQSQRIVGDNDRNKPRDPPRVTGYEHAPRLPESYYYLGHWMWQFGHFIVETLPALWAHQGEPLIAHRFGGTGQVHPWQQRLLELAGVDHPPVIVDSTPTRVAHLRVPTRPTVVGASVGPAAVTVWQRLARAAVPVDPVPHRLVALSRSQLELRGAKRARQVPNVTEVDRLWADLGFEIVHPEQLTIDEQLHLLREARVIIGSDGSALHASAFAQPGTTVIWVAAPHREKGNRTQQAIDSALGNPLAMLPHRRAAHDRLAVDLAQHARDVTEVLTQLPREPARPGTGPAGGAGAAPTL